MTSDRSSLGSRLRQRLETLRRRLRHEPQDKAQLLNLLRDARQRSVLDADALSMIEGVMQVSDLRVRDIMIPRAEMTFIRRDDPLDQILKVVVNTAHSRFPVIGDDKGDVVGVLIAKDLLSFCGSDSRRPFNLRDLVRSAVFVPESKRLNVLLKEFRSSRSHMAIVVDEYGTAAGLVTIEDVLEQIVGEIEDEHDFDEGPFIYKRSATEYTIKAHTSIEDFNETSTATCRMNSSTPSAAWCHNGPPAQGRRAGKAGRVRFTVKRADSRRLHRSRWSVKNPRKGEDEATPRGGRLTRRLVRSFVSAVSHRRGGGRGGGWLGGLFSV